jgi:hypothetical protein
MGMAMARAVRLGRLCHLGRKVPRTANLLLPDLQHVVGFIRPPLYSVSTAAEREET